MPFDAVSQDRVQASPIPFRSAEQAWFWVSRVLAARRAGRRWDDGIARICRPDDVLRSLDRLYRAGQIDHVHARVLRRWGERGRAPERRGGDRSDYRQWREALDRLEAVLRERGIVAGFDFSGLGGNYSEGGCKISSVKRDLTLTPDATFSRKNTEANLDGLLIVARAAGASRLRPSKFLPLAAISPPNPDRLRVVPNGATLSFSFSSPDISTTKKEI